MPLVRPKLSGTIKVRTYAPPQSETECRIAKGELSEDIKDVAFRIGLEDSDEDPLNLVNEQGLSIMGKLLADQIYYVSGGKVKGSDTSVSCDTLPDTSVIWAFDNRVLLHEPRDHRSPETPYRLERSIKDLKLCSRASLILPKQLLSAPLHPESKAEYCQARLASLSEICLFQDRGIYKDFIENGTVLKNLKSDVYCNEKTSSDAARISAGACIDIGMKVLKNISEIRVNDRTLEEKRLPSTVGFCLVRPPGHHCSFQAPSGFCLINNVAVSSACLLKNEFVFERDGDRRKPRIAILDLDVHFGEGTASFVDNYDCNDSSSFPLLYLSIHRFDSGKFYPFVADGSTENTGRNGSCICNIGVDTNAHIPSRCYEVISDFLFEKALVEIFFPRLLQFMPDLVFVSLGFDAAYGDPLGKMSVEGGFARTIMLLKKWCMGSTSATSETPVSPVPIGLICVLEGGYNPESVSSGITSVAHVLTFPSDDKDCQKFSERHVPKSWSDLRQREKRRGQEKKENEEEGNNGEILNTAMEDDGSLLSKHKAWCDSVIKNAKQAHLESSKGTIFK